MEGKIKGSLLKDIVKGIKSDRTHEKEYDVILSDRAKKFLNQRILDSIWYSWDVYCELYKALIKVVAKNNPKIVTKWGRDFGENVMSAVYKNIIAEGNVKKLAEKYPRFHSMFYNFGTISFEWISDHELLYTLKDFDPNFELFYNSNIGWTQRVFEMCLKKEVHFEILKKSSQGDKEGQFKLFWAP
ncbi:MAG: hypothetical protein JW891_04640 [Candidatus Lokiarchaeota archaeon]|nr:hypothetical protein [Candidatus Lokiarchaeota archaeon]